MDLQLYLHCHLLVECTDFNYKEMAASQYLGTKFGVTVNLTTKFYAELAREGIIYSWAHAKAFYQWIPISGKQGWDSFKQRIEECIYHSYALKTWEQRIGRKLPSRAWLCISTHHIEEQQQWQEVIVIDNENSSALITFTSPMTPKQGLPYTEEILERISKAFKGHRCAHVFDCDFMNWYQMMECYQLWCLKFILWKSMWRQLDCIRYRLQNFTRYLHALVFGYALCILYVIRHTSYVWHTFVCQLLLWCRTTETQVKYGTWNSGGMLFTSVGWQTPTKVNLLNFVGIGWCGVHVLKLVCILQPRWYTEYVMTNSVQQTVGKRDYNIRGKYIVISRTSWPVIRWLAYRYQFIP